MKKILIILLALMCILSGCNKKSTNLGVSTVNVTQIMDDSLSKAGFSTLTEREMEKTVQGKFTSYNYKIGDNANIVITENNNKFVTNILIKADCNNIDTLVMNEIGYITGLAIVSIESENAEEWANALPIDNVFIDSEGEFSGNNCIIEYELDDGNLSIEFKTIDND